MRRNWRSRPSDRLFGTDTPPEGALSLLAIPQFFTLFGSQARHFMLPPAAGLRLSSWTAALITFRVLVTVAVVVAGLASEAVSGALSADETVRFLFLGAMPCVVGTFIGPWFSARFPAPGFTTRAEGQATYPRASMLVCGLAWALLGLLYTVDALLVSADAGDLRWLIVTGLASAMLVLQPWRVSLGARWREQTYAAFLPEGTS